MKMAMEQCSALLQLVRDASSDAHSSKPSESELVDKLDDVRKQLHSAGSAEIPPESAAVAICQVTSQVLAFLVVQRPVAAREATSKWHKRVFMLEMAVASAWAGLGSSGGGDLGLELTERGDVCSTYKRLLQLLWEAFQESQQAYNAVAVMTNTAVLLAIGWLSYDRVGKLMKAEELLNVCSDFCLSHESTKKLVKWPLFLLGMAHVVQKQQHARALRCFRVVVEECDAVEDDGVFFYWYALVLLHNGRSGEAVAALDKCIRANFQPVACLSLQALVSVEALDYHAAAERLQRALHIDFSHANSLCNYALLMEQMGNFEAQEQLLEYVLESPGGGDTGHSADTQRKQPGEATNVVSTGASSTSLFDTTSSHSLLPSKLTKVDVSMVHLKLAEAAMENGAQSYTSLHSLLAGQADVFAVLLCVGRWQESKKQFEEFLDRGDLCKPLTTTIEATKDYIYVLLQVRPLGIFVAFDSIEASVD
jgi:tetratricopeptide (TPR) repeat protein